MSHGSRTSQSQGIVSAAERAPLRWSDSGNDDPDVNNWCDSTGSFEAGLSSDTLNQKPLSDGLLLI